MTTKITPKNVDRLQHVAISRLTLYMAAQIHVMLGELQTWLLTQVRQATDTDGNVEMAQLSAMLPALDTKWHRIVGDYTTLLQRARTQAGDIAFTPLWQRHNAFFPTALDRIQEAFTPSTNDWQQLAAMWLRRRNAALQVAQQRVWSDGLSLSQRLWRLDNGGLSQIRATIAQGMAERTSAVRLAQELELCLGADMDMPRWAYARLNQMTASERATDASGLLHDQVHRTQGVAYNALRLARNEIQYANHAVTSDIARNFPGITGRWVRLSPAHPKSDICDSVAAGGPYPKDYNDLPLHPMCMCRYEEAMMDPKQFAANVRGWLQNDNDFLNDYVNWLGLRQLAPMPATLQALDAMALWLDGNVDAMAHILQL